MLLCLDHYLHEEGNDEDSVPLAESVLQCVEQRAVPVDQMELQQQNTAVRLGAAWLRAGVENRPGGHQLPLTEGSPSSGGRSSASFRD